jgi:hypothetical protein
MVQHKTAIFRHVNKDKPRSHHDAVEFPNGEIVFLTELLEGQDATVLQVPARILEVKAQKRFQHGSGVGATPNGLRSGPPS